MNRFLLGAHADLQLDEIYDYTAATWGKGQADDYIGTLFEYFGEIASRNVTWRSVPAELGVDGYFGKCEHHFVYWKVLESGATGIVAILHERMHQIARIQDLFTSA